MSSRVMPLAVSQPRPAALAPHIGEPPLVSVIIPTYNRAATLLRALNSVLNQSYPHMEVLVVDDGSRDGTPEVMAAVDDPRVQYVRLEQNQGASAARNHGLGLARGKYIAFQDSDDEWLAGKLEQQVAAAEAAGADLVTVFHMKIVYGRDDSRQYGAGRACCVPRLGGAPGERDFVKLSHRDNLISPQTLMFSRAVLEQIGTFDRTLANSVDWDFSLRLVRRTKVIFIEEPLVMTYIQNDSISVNTRKRIRSQLRIAQKLKRQPDVDPRVLSEHFGRLGAALSGMGNRRRAARLLRLSLKLAPSRPKAWLRLAANAFGVKTSKMA